ncbi:MAG: hypothetical protein DRQ88_03710 [Epsilonproteobacteria bacterium]|nr:MAG: hypothetical protein DRQ89_03780 [Campylobacterota bacterium]RLA67281.1 MAG: hypothetical protein DRQ88_03710 [Campylobacterota bacterium]
MGSLKRLLLLFVILSATNSFSKTQPHLLEDFLKEFNQNPAKVFKQLPYKKISSDNATVISFTEKLIWRKEYLRQSTTDKMNVQFNDSVEGLFDAQIDLLLNAYKIDEQKLRSGKVKYTPWTGYYWSTKNGLIAYRYSDRKFKRIWNFKGKLKYIKKRPSSYYVKKGRINLLSPAEKYELLIGDENHSFSKYIWQKGLDEIEKYGHVRDWVGLCHGLALAPAALPRPKHSIRIKSFDGKHIIKFYPEDIKALGIYMWGGDYIPSRKVGGRCEKHSPKTDSIGRIIDSDCLDTNPATFHLAVINRIGVQKKALIIDSSYDKSVWNFPVINYKFTYYNPNTSKKMTKISEAMIPIDSFSNDKFKKHRSPEARYIVGVQANIQYLNFIEPKAKDKEPTASNPLINNSYRYDLELNANGDIIGGEWYSRFHPDFLWLPYDDIDPQAPYDVMMRGTWDAKNTLLPAKWAENAVLSAQNGDVSSPIVKALFELSHKGAEGILPR